MAANKYVYSFGGGKADGNAKMRNLLGGKGANLADMASLGLPVPPGFTITTEVCTSYFKNRRKYPTELNQQIVNALKKIEKIVGKKFGNAKNPLLMSVRSGARTSMPGMMETVLNIGLTTETIPGLIEQTGGNERFVYDSYRRLMTMYSDVVMEKSAGIEPKEGHGIRHKLETELENLKKKRKIENDSDISVEDLKVLCDKYKVIIKKTLKKPFPDNAMDQLLGGIGAVFQSWMGKRAIAYRKIEGIPAEWGTAVNAQAMVFGNLGDDSATGVAFTRNPATGENWFYGEWLINAQGEDVVAGIRTPYALNEKIKSKENRQYPSLQKKMPKIYKEFDAIRLKLEKHYKDMQDLEFTIENKRLWMLQTRNGKRTGLAALKMAVDMANNKLISKKEAISRVKPEQLDEVLHPMVDPSAEKKVGEIATGLPAGPGGAVGKVCFSPDRAEEAYNKGEKVILVREETSPEDVHGMKAAVAILTARGGMTSHAALVARGWGKCCIVGCKALNINYAKKNMTIEGKTVKEGDIITLNGTSGNVYLGELPLLEIDPAKNKELSTFLSWCDQFAKLKVRTNAESPEDSAQARSFGAQGIGLCRTEHMFFEPQRIRYVRQMICSDTEKDRRKAVMKLLPYQKKDFLGILKAMKDLPVTIRLLDPPLHEFLPHEQKQKTQLAKDLKISPAELNKRINQLHEFNPMLGHRGCRLGISYPEITEMQARAILEAAAELTKKKIKVFPEIMIPLVGHHKEFQNQKDIVMEVAKEVKAKYNLKKLDFMVGTMIEVPRGALTADEIAKEAQFFSFGTNDLTQMGCGFSRDDSGGFLPDYVARGIYGEDPFQSLDQDGVGQLVEIGVTKGRATRKNLKLGICGEHGGDPASIHFCHKVGLDYVSCSPFRVPIARLAAAQANLS